MYFLRGLFPGAQYGTMLHIQNFKQRLGWAWSKISARSLLSLTFIDRLPDGRSQIKTIGTRRFKAGLSWPQLRWDIVSFGQSSSIM